MQGGFGGASIEAMRDPPPPDSTPSPDSAPLIVSLPDAAATEQLGARVAAVAPSGLFIALDGPLGAGKTTLGRGFIRAWTGAPEVEAPSPTYTLVQTYDGPRGPVWHMDLYRLKAPEDADELGLEDAIGEAVCLVEWAERLGARLPRERLVIRLLLAPAGRIAQIAWVGGSLPDWIGHLS